MRILPTPLIFGLLVGLMGASSTVSANTACEDLLAQAGGAVHGAEPADFYYAEGLCLLRSDELEAGQWSWVKWLYLNPQALLPQEAQAWQAVYQTAQKESGSVGPTEIKVVKKQMHGSSQTLLRVEVLDPLELIYHVQLTSRDRTLNLRAAPKMELAVSGLTQVPLRGVSRQGQIIREIEVQPLMPSAGKPEQLSENAGPGFPWWVWAAVGGATVVTAGTGFWLWWDSRDDIYLTGRVSVGDAS